MDKADSAHVEGLLADVEVVAAHVDVGVAERGQQRGQRNVVVGKPLRIDVDMVFLGQSAEAGNVDYARYGFELLLENPVLDLFLFQQVVVGTFHRVTIDLTDRIFRRDARRERPAAAG